jgi:hypothetical protein
MSQKNEKMTLQDADFELLMLHADGELAADQLAKAQQLLAESAAARAVWQDLQLGREMMRQIAVSDVQSARVDLSLLPGQVMRKLPDDAALHVVTATPPNRGLIAWIQGLGLGKVGLTMGLATAAVAFMVARAGTLVETPTRNADAEIAAVPGTNLPAQDNDPMVIIEEMEIESGTLMVHPPGERGGSTVIWHFSDDKGAPGTGGEG